MQILTKLLNIFSAIDKSDPAVAIEGNSIRSVRNGRNVQLLNLGVVYPLKYLSAESIQKNITLLETLIKYNGDPKYLVSVYPRKKRYWEVTVFFQGEKVLSDKIKFFDNKIFPSFLIKQYFWSKYNRRKTTTTEP